MQAIAYYDGKIGAPEELMVPFNDRVHFFGDGVYDATVGANGKVYLLRDHLDRFYTSAKALDIHIPMEKAALGELLTDLLGKVDGTTHFVYWQVTRGINDRNHVYPEGMPGKLWVMIRPNHLNDPDVPIRLVTAPDTRFYHCNIKTLNLIPSVMAAQDAARRGVQETVFHRDGIVTECAHSNVSILKDGVFYSHPNDELILRGIAKTHMIQACYRLGITVMEKPYTLDDLRAADEIIVTSSSNFCLHACELDGAPAGGKDPGTLKAIQDAVLQEYYDYTGKTSVLD
ncbi:aminotransferase class IV [uncultured Subdoligranulum sp.]|uniref:aminotransferase class IV n=1 Tax=uncultured Subdoligranulum sp. TaxID=512298 RepID=UPI003209BFAF